MTRCGYVVPAYTRLLFKTTVIVLTLTSPLSQERLNRTVNGWWAHGARHIRLRLRHLARPCSASQMLYDNSTLERLMISNTDMTEVGFTAVLAALRKGNSTIMELSIGSQLLRSREVFRATRGESLRQRDANAFI